MQRWVQGLILCTLPSSSGIPAVRPFSALVMLVGVLLASAGYGATFLFSMHVRAIGGNDINTGVALAGAALGTFVGVSLTGWVAQHVGAARMAALAALCVGAGVVTYRPEFAYERDWRFLGGPVVGVVGTLDSTPYAFLDEFGRYPVLPKFLQGSCNADNKLLNLRLLRPSSSYQGGFHSPLLPGTEVMLEAAHGDVDRLHISGALHDHSHQDPVRGSDALFSYSIWRAPLLGAEIVFNDLRDKESARIATVYSQTAFNQGYLLNSKKLPRGEGFEATTKSWGTMRAAKGLFFSADAAAGADTPHLDMPAAVAQLKAALQRVKELAAATTHANAEPADRATQAALLDGLNELRDAGLLASAPGGMAFVTPKSAQHSAGQNVIVTAGQVRGHRLEPCIDRLRAAALHPERGHHEAVFRAGHRRVGQPDHDARCDAFRVGPARERHLTRYLLVTSRLRERFALPLRQVKLRAATDLAEHRAVVRIVGDVRRGPQRILRRAVVALPYLDGCRHEFALLVHGLRRLVPVAVQARPGQQRQVDRPDVRARVVRENEDVEQSVLAALLPVEPENALAFRMPRDEVPDGLLVHHDLLHLLLRPFEMELNVEGVEVLTVHHQLADHFLERDILHHVGSDDPLAQGGKARLEANLVGGLVTARADALPARRHAIEGGRGMVDGTRPARRGHRCPLVDLQASTQPHIVLAIKIELWRRDRDVDLVVLAEPATYPEVKHIELKRPLADPDSEMLGEPRARVAQHIREVLCHSIHAPSLFLSA